MARPFVHVNSAASLDGRIAAPDGSPMMLSDDADWARVHALRAECDAILVGVQTVLNDDPSLRIKREHYAGPGRDPLRVVLDTRGRTPRSARVVDGHADTLILHAPGVEADWPKCDQREVPLGEGGLDIAGVLDALDAFGVKRVLVEGGARVIRSFMDAAVVDKWTIYQAPVVVGGDGPQLWPGRPSGQGRRLHVEHVMPQGKGVLWTLRP